MHSRIFQLSTKKLPKDEWINEFSISDSEMGYYGIDYCDETDTYKEDLEELAKILPKDVFKMKGRKIEIISDGSCLFENYKARILKMVLNMEYDRGEYQFLGLTPYKIGNLVRNILNTDFLFFIDEEGDNVERSNALVSYAFNAMNDEKYPKTLYINGILDYHF